MKKIVFYFASIYGLFLSCTCFAENTNSLGIVQKVEENLIYSKEVEKPQDPGEIIIKKGGWDESTTTTLDNVTANKNNSPISAEIIQQKEDKEIIAMKRKAFDAMAFNQYEIAVKIYKDILKKDKNDAYANLGLATAYQYLGQYPQAKPLLMQATKDFPTDQQVAANLLSIVIDESPYEAVYLVSSIADQNKTSPLFQAQASLAYTRVKNYDKAMEYIEKAIKLDDTNLEYQYNLAVLYDLKGEDARARYLYTQLLTYPDDPNSNFTLPRTEIQYRINGLKNNNK